MAESADVVGAETIEKSHTNYIGIFAVHSVCLYMSFVELAWSTSQKTYVEGIN
jgi:hypothetical protein